MKQHRVIITVLAEAVVREICQYIRQDSPSNAAAWRSKFDQLAKSLVALPERCPLAPESQHAKFEIRQLLFGNYRILFTIRDDVVAVLHVRHGAREWMEPDEIAPPDQP
jgi:plasmid stabilization system protein ParE